MEATGAILRRVPISFRLRRDAGEPSLSCPSRVRVSARPRRVSVGNGGFSEQGHLTYYVSPVRCGEKKKDEKKRQKLVKTLSRDLSAFYSMGFDVENGEGEVKGKMISEAAELLMTQLNQLRAEAKEMKRRKKQEKTAAKVAKMKDCADESSSTSSSESDSECETVVKMSRLRTVKDLEETKPDCLEIPREASEPNPDPMTIELKAGDGIEIKEKAKDAGMKDCANESSSSSSESSDSECETVVKMSSLIAVEDLKETKPDCLAIPREASKFKSEPVTIELKAGDGIEIKEKPMPLKLEQVSSISSCSNSSVVVGKSMDKIEVCLGGKCKKSGALELLEEFEKKVGIEGAVVGCKCMGKCRDGPNVRVGNQSIEKEDSVKVSMKPLCIGVGLEDVGAIVDNFFGEKKDMGLMAA